LNNHIQITFPNIQPEQQEWLIAHLSEIGYEGFEENSNELKAFIGEKDFDRELLKEIAFKYQLSFTENIIPAQNWNAVWESNFQPVLVDDFVMVRAHFHPPASGVEQEIVITPKMSFGTGHHATTWMMMRQMRSIDFTGKSVFDFGTGTGVLAILAAKLGAASVVAVDIDEWSITNGQENISRNNVGSIDLHQADSAEGESSFDIILANINRNVILDNLLILSGRLNKGGILLLSGLLKEDEEVVRPACESHSLVFESREVRDNWICIKFVS
jgi:ribosomal protein L11 methyltransferase